MDDANDGGVTDEVSRRHGHSSQPESQQIMAVLNAVKEMIVAENLAVTPTALFAATMSALEKPDTQQSAQVRSGWTLHQLGPLSPGAYFMILAGDPCDVRLAGLRAASCAQQRAAVQVHRLQPSHNVGTSAVQRPGTHLHNVEIRLFYVAPRTLSFLGPF
jgi:hypothetical protein